MAKPARLPTRTPPGRRNGSRPHERRGRRRHLTGPLSLSVITAEIKRCEERLRSLQRARNDCSAVIGAFGQ
jgi:hypothetical protein